MNINDFEDNLNAEIDKRKVEALNLEPEALANAPIITIEPVCRCNQGLEPVGAKLLCPKCLAPGEETDRQ